MQMISGFKAEVCYLTMVFLSSLHVYQIGKRHFGPEWWKHQCLTMENLHRKLLIASEVLIPMLWSWNLSELWSHTYGKRKYKRLQCRCQSVSLKTSFGRIYGQKYHVIYAEKKITTPAFFFTKWFCYRLEILNHFRGAKHKAKKNLYYIYFMLCKPLS